MFNLKAKKKKTEDIAELLDYLKKLSDENTILKKEIDNTFFVNDLIHQTGDLIHYQQGDYKDKYPKNSVVYGFVGEILRRIASKGKTQYTVEQLVANDSSITTSVPENYLKALSNFNAPALVDLVSRMQGGILDNGFEEKVQEVMQLRNIKS